MLLTFLIWVSSNLSQQKSPTAENYRYIFSQTIVPRKYMPIISTVGLFCCDKFEETQNKKVVNMSKLTKSYFKFQLFYILEGILYPNKNLLMILCLFLVDFCEE